MTSARICRGFIATNPEIDPRRDRRKLPILTESEGVMINKYFQFKNGSRRREFITGVKRDNERKRRTVRGCNDFPEKEFSACRALVLR